MSIFEEGSDKTQETEEEVSQEQTTQTQETVPPKRDDTLERMLQGITNSEGKPKYSNVEDAIKSIPHAQSHIKTLETENQGLKDEISTLKEQVETYKEEIERYRSLEDILDKREDTKGLSQEELDQYFEQKLAQREQQATAAQNQKSVASSLVELFGDKTVAEQEFIKMQNDLGIDLVELSAKSPKAVLKYFEKASKSKDIPDHFNGKTAGEFVSKTPETKAVMPRTTQEAKNAWRQSVEEVNKKLGI